MAILSHVEKARLLVLNLDELEPKERIRHVQQAMLALCEAVASLEKGSVKEVAQKPK